MVKGVLAYARLSQDVQLQETETWCRASMEVKYCADASVDHGTFGVAAPGAVVLCVFRAVSQYPLSGSRMTYRPAFKPPLVHAKHAWTCVTRVATVHTDESTWW